MAVLVCLAAAAAVNRAVPHMHELVHGLEAFAAAVAVWLVTSLNSRLQRREDELAALEERRARAERVAALTSLAAGAAHELATPLATISVVAREMERAAERREDDHALDDVELIQREVSRCREVLDQLSIEGGELAGEAPSDVDATTLLEATSAKLSPGDRDRVRFRVAGPSGAPHDMTLTVRVPVGGTARVLAGLIDNALQASAEGDAVDVVLSGREGATELLVSDRGAGMDEATIARAQEPFFTTRGAPGETDARRGMGLGLFLASSFADQLGGDLSIRSAPGEGTQVLLTLPQEVAS